MTDAMREPSAQELIDYAALVATGNDLTSVIAFLSDELPTCGATPIWP